MESVCLPGSPLSADELRQGLPGVSKVARWKPSLASQTAPQSDESGRVAGEPHGSQSVSEVDRKKPFSPSGIVSTDVPSGTRVFPKQTSPAAARGIIMVAEPSGVLTRGKGLANASRRKICT